MSISKFRGFAACVAFTICTSLMGETFFAKGISYKTTCSTTPYTVEVVEQVWNKPEYTGKIKIPHYVKHNGIRYRVTGIGKFAFAHCENLNSIWIPNSVVYIGLDAFSHCKMLAEIRIPNSVTDIESGAFNHCSNIKSFTIPDGVKNIGWHAFQECKNLKSIKISRSVENVGNYIFQACSSLTSIKIDKRNRAYDSRNNCNAIIETNDNILIAGCRTTKIPNSVEILDYGSYSELTDIYVIKIPYGVTIIKGSAFENCRDLVSVEISSSVVQIGDDAFKGCNNLSTITCLAKTPPKIRTNILPSKSDQVTIYVPCASIQAYKDNQHWRQYNIQCIEQ